MTEDEIKEADFAAFLASSSEDEDEQQREQHVQGAQQGGAGAHAAAPRDKKAAAAAMRERYRALLLGGSDAANGKSTRAKGKASKQPANGKHADGSEEESDEEQEGQAAAAPGRVGGKSWGDEPEEEEEAEQLEAGPSGRGKQRKAGRDGLEMEVTYAPGLEGLGKRLLDAKRDQEAKKGETVWEQYLRRRKEKRKEMKLKKLQESSSDEDEDDLADNAKNDEGFFKADGDGDDPFADPFFEDPNQGMAEPASGSDEDDDASEGVKKGKGKAAGGKDLAFKGKATKGRRGGKGGGSDEEEGQAQDPRRIAELELLMMDDDDIRLTALKGASGPAARLAQLASSHDDAAGANGNGKQKLGKKAKRLAKRNTQRSKAAALRDDDADEPAAAGFKADLSDPRFQALISDHAFALDPTDPRFKALKSSNTVQQVQKLKKARGPGVLNGTDVQAGKGGKAAIGAGAAAANDAGAHDRQQQQAFSELRGMVAKLKRKNQQQQQAGQQQQGKRQKAGA